MEYIKRKIGFLTYSNIEVFDIFKAWIAISIAFGIVLGGLTTKFFTAFLIVPINIFHLY